MREFVVGNYYTNRKTLSVCFGSIDLDLPSATLLRFLGSNVFAVQNMRMASLATAEFPVTVESEEFKFLEPV